MPVLAEIEPVFVIPPAKLEMLFKPMPVAEAASVLVFEMLPVKMEMD
jgi:hypothetical protein